MKPGCSTRIGTAHRLKMKAIRWPVWWPLCGLLLLGGLSCESTPSSPLGQDPPDEANEVTFTVLYTNDEHGWIEESAETDGAAKLMGIWKGVEGYVSGGSVLVVSGGDNWTGPAISTWFQGEPMVEVMNAMGYVASAVGNHEFDFDVSGLEARIAQAKFPYLSSNIRLKATGAIPGFATPFTLRQVGGVTVGLVGLTATSTPYTAFPAYVEDFDFISYESALNEWVPQARNAGADVVMVVGHICRGELKSLVSVARSLGVTAMGGGHCHERVAEVDNGVALVIGGSQMEAYGKVRVTFDLDSGAVTGLQASTSENQGGTADASVEAIVARWQAAAAAELSTVIGFAQGEIADGSPELHNLITDSWLYAYPAGDIVLTNAGGVRQGIPAGEITRGTIVGVLPFLNSVIELEMTGNQVVSALRGDIILAGIKKGGEGFLHSDGTPLVMDSVYHVLTTDYLYARDDLPFSGFDPEPYATSLTYSEPTVMYLQFLATNAADPLENYLDPEKRR